MADGVAYTAYQNWLHSPKENAEYCRGQIGGLESLFQNFDKMLTDFDEYVEELKKSMELEENDADTAPSGD